VVFYISNDRNRSIATLTTLRVSDGCAALSQANRRAWEATPSAVLAATTLRSLCAPRKTG